MNLEEPKQNVSEFAISEANDEARAQSLSIQALETRLRAQQLQHAEALEQLTYAVSHDMSEFLRMVRSYVQLENRRNRPGEAESNEFATYLTEGAQRMEQLLSELVVYSRQFRPVERPASALDTEAVLEGVLLNLDLVMRKADACVTHDALPQVFCDATPLSHLFRHLIVNAITFRKQEPPRIHISAAEEPSQAIFTVQDNGLGIDPRFHEQIFAMFKRLHGREYPGNGLGLAICKRIVEQYGGRIWVESTPNQGSTFRFTLPR